MLRKLLVSLLIVSIAVFCLVSCDEEDDDDMQSTTGTTTNDDATPMIAGATVTSYKVGDTGPAGGYVFYDCDADNDSGNADNLTSSACGWRYLEAAPTDLSNSYKWGAYGAFGTSTEIGSGSSNSIKIRNNCALDRSISVPACFSYSVKGYGSWFLPSKDELNLMYVNLHKAGKGGFAGDYYWSSSETSGNALKAWIQYFGNGNQYDLDRYIEYRVRPIRAF